MTMRCHGSEWLGYPCSAIERYCSAIAVFGQKIQRETRKAGARPLCTGFALFSIDKVHDERRQSSCLTDVQIRFESRFNFGPPPW